VTFDNYREKVKQYEEAGMWSHAAELADKHCEKTKDKDLKMRALDNYKKAGYDVTGIEPSKWAAEFAQKKTGAEVLHGSWDEVSLPENRFDVITIWDVIEHLDDIIKVMEELHRIGKPGALVKIDVPFFRAKWAFLDPTHKHFFTTESFTYFDPDHDHSRLFPYSSKRFKVERLAFNEKITDNNA